MLQVKKQRQLDMVAHEHSVAQMHARAVVQGGDDPLNAANIDPDGRHINADKLMVRKWGRREVLTPMHGHRPICQNDMGTEAGQ